MTLTHLKTNKKKETYLWLFLVGGLVYLVGKFFLVPQLQKKQTSFRQLEVLQTEEIEINLLKRQSIQEKRTVSSHPLNVIEHLKQSFAQTYLTLISIIQGVAFGYLTTVVFYPSPNHFALYQWFLIYTTFFVITGIWQEYMIGSNVNRWVPTIADTFIPFSFAVVEVFLISFLGDIQAWFLIAAILWLVAILGYINLYTQIARHYEDNKNVIVPLRRHRLRMITFIWSSINFILYSLLWGISMQTWATDKIYLYLSIASAAIISLYFIRFIVYMKFIVDYNRLLRGI